MNTPIRRIVTGHDKSGTAVFTSDDTYETVIIPSGDAAIATIWTTATVPADLNDETDGRERDAGTTLKGGSVIRVVDMLPGASSPMHRTNSIDYGIILSGSVELELDNKEFKTLETEILLYSRAPYINGVIMMLKQFAVLYLYWSVCVVGY